VRKLCPCGDRAGSHIPPLGCEIVNYQTDYDEWQTTQNDADEFLCQSAAKRILETQIPLPAGLANLIQTIDLMGVSGIDRDLS
jgi:hypothetical protein